MEWIKHHQYLTSALLVAAIIMFIALGILIPHAGIVLVCLVVVTVVIGILFCLASALVEALIIFWEGTHESD